MAQQEYKALPLDSKFGFGTMSMTWKVSPPPFEQSIETLKYVTSHPEFGTNLINGGEFYGADDVNLKLLKQFLEGNTDEENSKLVVCIKGGLVNMRPDGSKENITKSIENIISYFPSDPSKRPKLLFEIARVDLSTPYEKTVGYIAEFVKAGKIDGISLSEVGAHTIKKAASVFPVTCVEVELSLFCQDVLHNGVLEELSRQQVPLVAYSPLARGLLTDFASADIDKFVGSFNEFDTRKTDKVSPANLEHNKQYILKLADYAHNVKKTSLESFALSWVLGISGKKEFKGIKNVTKIIPIPSGSTKEKIHSNFTNLVELTDEDYAAVDQIHKEQSPKGYRYQKEYEALSFA